MQFLTNLLGGSENAYLTMALALGIVIALIVLGLWALKLIFRATSSATIGRNRRLSVVDTLALDAKRQLVIVRRDNVEHLLLIGGAQDVLVESGIEAAARPERQPRSPPIAPSRADRARSTKPEPRTPANDMPPPPLPENAAPRPSAQIRDFSRPADLRRTSLRHTGLLRPVSTLDTGVVRLTPEKSPGSKSDSVRSETSSRDGGLGGTSGGIFGGEPDHLRN